MERYRIVKVPQLKSEPLYRIEIYVKETITRYFLFTTEINGWFSVDRRGNRITKITGRHNFQESMCLFHTQKEAEKKINNILDFNAGGIKVVFDTLTANPPQNIGT